MSIDSLPDLDTLAKRQQLVNQFMARLAKDEVLGSVFGSASQLEQQAWWDSALTGTCYQGRPLRATHRHSHIGPLYERWCQLLKNTFDRSFNGPEATAAQGHVLNLATMLTHWQLAQQHSYSDVCIDDATRKLAAA